MTKTNKIILLLGDVIVLYLSLFITLAIRYGTSKLGLHFTSHALPFSAIFTMWLVVFYLFDLYRLQNIIEKNTLLKNVVSAILVSEVLSIIGFYAAGGLLTTLTPKTNLLIYGIIALLLTYMWRVVASKMLTSGFANVIIIGSSALVEKTAEYINIKNHTGYRIIQHIKKIKPDTATSIQKTIERNHIHTIIIEHGIAQNQEMLHTVYKLIPSGIYIMDFAHFFEIVFEKIPLEELEEGWFIENITTRRTFYDSMKRVIDIVCAALAIIVLCPLVALIAGLIKLTSPSEPIIFKQKRAGRNNTIFELYKFRSMREIKNIPLWPEESENRITPIGKIIRVTHLDEIPQLINVLKGDISLIGPRPERLELAEEYSKIPYYEMRHVIKPGLTGWAQVNYPASVSIEEAKEKLCYDIFYIKNRSFLLDFLIAVRTIKYLFVTHEPEPQKTAKTKKTQKVPS